MEKTNVEGRKSLEIQSDNCSIRFLDDGKIETDPYETGSGYTEPLQLTIDELLELGQFLINAANKAPVA